MSSFCGQFSVEKSVSELKMKFLWLLCFLHVGGSWGQIKHNLPPGVELVDPKSLGFDESQLDLSSLLGNVKLTPINSAIDPQSGLKTQVLTVGFDGEENINLDDFELPQQQGNNSQLVQNAFASFKEYFKNKPQTVTPPQEGQGQTTPPQVQVQSLAAATTPPQIVRRRKIKKTTPPQQPPKIVELESDQIEKLLATGKLKSKKIGDSQVIEITQEQLNELYASEGGGEFRELLQQQQPQPHPQEIIEQPQILQQQPRPQIQQQIQQIQQQIQQPQVVQQQIQQPHPQIQIQAQPPQHQQITTPPQIENIIPITPPPPTQPPIIYQFNTNDYESRPRQQYSSHAPISHTPTINHTPTNQIQKHIKTPTFEFISVPPVSFSSSQTAPVSKPISVTANRGRVYFPAAQAQQTAQAQAGQTAGRFHRHLTPAQLNTYFEDDGLNYKDNNNNNQGDEELRGV